MCLCAGFAARLFGEAAEDDGPDHASEQLLAVAASITKAGDKAQLLSFQQVSSGPQRCSEVEISRKDAAAHLFLATHACNMCVLLQEQFFRQWQSDRQPPANHVGFNAVIAGSLDLAALQKAAIMVFQRQQVHCAVLQGRAVSRCTRLCSPQNGSQLLQVLRSRVVVSEGSAKAAASQSILPMQQAVLPFDCSTLAAAYVTCIDVQEGGVCSVIAGTADDLLPGCPHALPGMQWQGMSP